MFIICNKAWSVMLEILSNRFEEDLLFGIIGTNYHLKILKLEGNELFPLGYTDWNCEFF